MWKHCFVLLLLIFTACGYKLAGWRSDTYKTLAIPKVRTVPQTRTLGLRMRDALVERCLTGSGLEPVDGNGDLVLQTRLLDYRERIIATGTDGRTERIQFTLVARFDLNDSQGGVIWSLSNYQYSDQYAITTGRGSYRDETVFIQDQAMRTIADLVITNMTLALNEREKTQ